MLKPIPFIGGHYQSRSSNANDQRTINFYPSIDQVGGKELILEPTPGLKEWCATGLLGEVRCIKRVGTTLYALVGNTVYQISTGGVATALAITIGSSTGDAWMEYNANNQIMLVAGNYGYVIAGGAVVAISDADFETPTSLTYQDGYGIITELNSGRFWISGLNDFLSWDALEYGSAETLPDNVIAGLSDHRELWMFGEDTIEAFQNTGNNDFPFERINGASAEIGIAAPGSIAKLDNSIFFLDQYRNVRKMDGYTPVIVSTPQIAYQFSLYPSAINAKAMAYVHEGHSFYILTFPGIATWVYDASTGLWHQRSSYPNAPAGPWRGNCYAYFNEKHLFGDYDNGKIYELDHTTYMDNGYMVPSVRCGQEISGNRMNMFLREFELHIEAGIGLNSGQGSDPMVMLRYSKDGGHTWSSQKWRSMGKIGEFHKRVRWNRLGKARSFIPEITITDPVNRVILGAYLDYAGGKS